MIKYHLNFRLLNHKYRISKKIYIYILYIEKYLERFIFLLEFKFKIIIDV